MSEWRETTLGEIAYITMGQSPKGDTCNNKGEGIPLLNGPTEFGSQHPYPIQFTIDPKKIANKGDLLFCVRGSTTGRMNWADKQYAIGRGVASILAKDGSDVQPYIKAVIEYKMRELLAVTTGSTFPNISREQLLNLTIRCPEQELQKTISIIIYTLDAKIDNLRRQNETLEKIAQLLFKRWFIDFEFPNADGKPYKSSGGVMVASELGDIPEGWQVGLSGEFFTLQGGFAFKSEDFQATGKHKVIKIKNISGNIVDISQTDFINDLIASRTNKKFQLLSGDILIAMTGAEVAKIGVVQTTGDSLFLNQRVGVFREIFFGGKLYTYYLFSREEYQRLLRDRGSGSSAQPNISASDIESININIPALDILKKFSEISSPLFTSRCNNLSQIKTLTKIRDLLLPKLMSGKIRIEEGDELK